MISVYRRTPPAHVYQQISEMAAAYVADLSLVPVAPSNYLTAVYEFSLAKEIETYMDRMGLGPGRTELIVAEDSSLPGRVTGFLLHLLVDGVPGATGVAYMAVHQKDRRTGVARTMVTELLSEYPHVELSCSVSKVPVYERLGFQVIGARDTQVRLNTRTYSAAGLIAALNVADIFASAEVKQIQQQIIEKYGRRALSDSTKQITRAYNQEVRRAEAYVRERIGRL
ncbi:GNAT family N-acetyltransferase [Stutzerimonas stutzeri]|uniref:GNAT family N-acetyltransferase n=1 Tax=Stutzerimonas stutzeri TaxID=316 RepID=A0AA40V6C4_STUST|nr:GNAT family N-acetyltransferase [Stutzerimonas stutzeri]